MITKKQIIIGAMICLSLVPLLILKTINNSPKNECFVIGILQTASHPALNAVQKGFITTLQKELQGKVQFIIKNTEGSIFNAHAIASQFHTNKNINMIFAIATPAAQAIAAIEKEKPILIAAVSDPQAAGLIHPNGNISGTCDMIDVPQQIHMIKTLLPDVKTVAILFNTSEVNSRVITKKMKAALEKATIKPIPIGITSEADIPIALEMALKKADAIVTPTDNSVASSIKFIANKTLQAKKPLIVSDNLLVKFGALASRGIDYEQSGHQAARIALQILMHDKKPSDLPIACAENSKIFINQDTLKTLGIHIPKELKPHIVLVEQENGV